MPGKKVQCLYCSKVMRSDNLKNHVKIHDKTANKFERARSPVINRVHYSPPADDLHIEQKKLDKLHEVFRKSDTVDNHTIHRFGDGKQNQVHPWRRKNRRHRPVAVKTDP